MTKRFTEWLALTKTERNVILFLTVTLLCGAGIRLFQEMFPSAQQFDYHASDSTFAALSTITEDSADAASIKSGSEEGSEKININTATKQQLMDLPGIGEVTADRILRYRRETGKFSTVEDLRVIRGISANKLERLKPMISTQ
jgi:competence ComEA-like helix-hairpin-helix protein